MFCVLGSHLLSRVLLELPSLVAAAAMGDAAALDPPNRIPISGVHIPGVGDAAAATEGGATLALVGKGAASGGPVRGVPRGCC